MVPFASALRRCTAPGIGIPLQSRGLQRQGGNGDRHEEADHQLTFLCCRDRQPGGSFRLVSPAPATDRMPGC